MIEREPEKWTKGPWQASRPGETNWEIGALGNRCLAIIRSYEDDDEEMKAEAEANARLIAAAPELAEALEICLEYIRDRMAQAGEESYAGYRARTALSQARGPKRLTE